MVLEMGYQQDPTFVHRLEVMGNLLTGLFIIELLIRYWVAQQKAPFLQSLLVGHSRGSTTHPSAPLFRVLRILRLFRAGLLLNRRMSSFESVFQGTITELTTLAASSLVLVLSAAVVLVISEGATGSELAHFETAVWFSIFSLVAGEPIGGTP